MMGGFRDFADAAVASPRSVARVRAIPAAMVRLRAMFFLPVVVCSETETSCPILIRRAIGSDALGLATDSHRAADR